MTNPPKNLMYLENLFGFIYSQEALPNLISSDPLEVFPQKMSVLSRFYKAPEDDISPQLYP